MKIILFLGKSKRDSKWPHSESLFDALKYKNKLFVFGSYRGNTSIIYK